jgi:hypothetical protein
MFNYESVTSYVVEVAAFDGVNVVARNLTIKVVDVNDAPTIIGLTSTDILENEKRDSVVAELKVYDEDAGQTVRCVVVDNKQFSLEKNLLVLFGELDYETMPTIPLKITCVDDGVPALYTSKTVDIRVIDGDDKSQVTIKYFPVYENITAGYVVATVSVKCSSRHPDFVVSGNNVVYVGSGLNYDTTKRIYVVLDADVGTVALTFDVIDLFNPPTGLEWEWVEIGDEVIGEIYVIGKEDQDKYGLMMQNHLDLFALKDKTVVSVVDHLPASEYVLEFVVNQNEQWRFSLQFTISTTRSTTTRTTTTRSTPRQPTTTTYEDRIDAAIINNPSDKMSNSTLIGVVIGSIMLIVIIVVLLVIVFRKNDSSVKHADEEFQKMMSNPIFVNSNNVVVSLGIDNIENPMYFSNISTLHNNYTEHRNIATNPTYGYPQLPLKNSQIDMVRSLADENTGELYGNVAEAKNAVIHDLNV